MRANPALWRSFLWACDVLDHFWMFPNTRRWQETRVEYYNQGNGTNLCHLVRTLLFGVLLFLLGIGSYLYALAAALVVPFVLYSAFSVIKLFTIIGVIIGCLVGLVYGLAYSISWMIEYRETHPKQRKPKVKSDEIGFVRAGFSYVMALKHHICPLIGPPSQEEPAPTSQVSQDEAHGADQTS